MRRALIILGSAALVGALGVAALLTMVSAETYRAEIERIAAAEIGRPVRIAGPMRFTLDPALAIRMEDVFLSESSSETGVQGHADRAVATVELLPLLTGEVRVRTLTLVGADIRIPEKALGGLLQEDVFDTLGLGGLHLVDSTIGLDETRTLKADDLVLGWPEGGTDLTVQGRLTWRNRSFDVDATIGQRHILLSGAPVPVRLAFKSPVGSGVLEGMTEPGAGRFDGTVNMTAPSARRLALFLGTRLPGDRGLGAFSLAATLKAEAPDTLMLSDAKFTLDAMTGGGMLEMVRTNGRLALDGAISVDQLDVNAYVTLEEPEMLDESGGWSEARMDLSSLATFDAQVQLMARRLNMGGARLQKINAGISLKDGMADIEMASGTINGGLARGRMKIDVRSGLPGLNISLQALGFDTQGFFADVIDSSALTGRGDLALSLQSQGASRKELVAGLRGSVELKVTDGMLNGIDLGGVARSVLASSGPSGLTDADGTNFSSLEAKLTLSEGRARIRDLTLIAPYLRSKVEGTFGLPARTMRVFVKPRAAPDLYGQHDDTAVGFPMPFAVTGHWNAPTIVADWASLALMLDENELTISDLERLPEPSRTWFLDQMKSGVPFPALPDVAGSEPATDLR